MTISKKENIIKAFRKLTLFIPFISLFFVVKPNPVQAQVCNYNACKEGPLCYFGDLYYSPGDYIIDETIDFYTQELKIVPQPNFFEYRIFICRLDDCQSSAPSTVYCEIGAVRNCGGTSPYPYPYPYGGGGLFRCVGDPATVGPPDGDWVEVPPGTPITGRCEDMLDTMRIAYTPGYIKTYTPYLYNIWSNTVNKVQSIFTPFRTVLNKTTFDWPGESNVTYEFDPTSGEGHAEGGQPPYMYPGWDAKFYFRYLGYIHCAKENLLQKISPILDREYPYIYYDERCNIQLW